MKVKSKFYPHPVLYRNNDDYVSSNFDAAVKTFPGPKKIHFEVEFHLDNRDIEEHINNRDMAFLLHIECPLTGFRDAFKSNHSIIVGDLNASEVRGNVEITPMIIVENLLRTYSNNNFNSIFGDISINELQKGDLIAISDGFELPIFEDLDNLSNVESIINVRKSDKNHMDVQLEGNRIVVMIPKKEYESFVTFSKSAYNPILISSIITPALIYTLTKLRHHGVSEYEHTEWYYSLKVILEKMNLNIEDNNISEFELSQKILDNPEKRMFEFLKSQE